MRPVCIYGMNEMHIIKCTFGSSIIFTIDGIAWVIDLIMLLNCYVLYKTLFYYQSIMKWNLQQISNKFLHFRPSSS